MKKFIVLFMALVTMCVTTAKAQSSQLATLNHEGTVSTFYGANALQQAYAAANVGDVITLSSGVFNAVDIKKAITLRGAGMFIDTDAHTEPTVLAGDYVIDIADNANGRLIIEGIYGNQTITIRNLNNAMFLKDRFNKITYSNSEFIWKDLSFVHCRVTDEFYMCQGSVSFVNCVLKQVTEGNSNKCNFSFNNTIISNYGCGMTLSEYKNCILINGTSSRYDIAHSSSVYYNNLFVSSIEKAISGINNSTNIRIPIDDERVANLKGTVSDSNDFKLKEEAKSILTGLDGKEVGIYGGNLPYSPTPTNPQISKFNVASKTTADGKLSVDIEVKSAE